MTGKRNQFYIFLKFDAFHDKNLNEETKREFSRHLFQKGQF
jgi:hypothetical protein